MNNRIDPGHVILLRGAMWRCRDTYLTSWDSRPVEAKLRGFKGLYREMQGFVELAQLPLGLVLLAIGK